MNRTLTIALLALAGVTLPVAPAAATVGEAARLDQTLVVAATTQKATGQTLYVHADCVRQKGTGVELNDGRKYMGHVYACYLQGYDQETPSAAVPWGYTYQGGKWSRTKWGVKVTTKYWAVVSPEPCATCGPVGRHWWAEAEESDWGWTGPRTFGGNPIWFNE